MAYSKMAYYYSIPWYVVDEMPTEVLAGYLNSLEIIHSQEALVDLETNSFPNAKRDDKKKVLDKYEKKALMFTKPKISTVDEMIGKLNHGI